MPVVSAPVLLANSDLLDTLRVEHLPFPHPSFNDIGHFGSGAGLLSWPCVASDGGACSSTPIQRSQASVKRPNLTASDRFFWAWMAATWRSWRSALILVKPDTGIAWHRKGFRLFWMCKSRHGRRGRPSVAVETRQLIRKMSRDNPLWGTWCAERNRRRRRGERS
jgi:hypothetical protein